MPTLEFKGKSFVYTHHLTVPFRELVIDPAKSLPAPGAKPSLQDNLIIHGDNLHALKALLPVYAGKVDCIYIDPPYNTGNEGWCYNDNVRSPLMREWLKKAGPVDREDLERHDKWLCMMWPRLQLLHELLAEDGAIFVSIDDNEVHRLRAVMDEIFGEENFIANIVWQKIFSPKNTAKYFSEDHDHILAYAKHLLSWTPNLLQRSEDAASRYENLDEDPRGAWSSSDLTARNFYSLGTYEVTSPSGKKFRPAVGTYWRVSFEKFQQLDADKRIWWGEHGNNMPRLKRFLSEVKQGVVPQTLWLHRDVGHTQEAKQELKDVLAFEDNESVFITPKPVRLIQRILEIATDEDSLVLDSFAGSGTTAHAVLALNRKDGGQRRFILVECEDYADRLTAERVRRVIRGYAFTGTQREELMREPITLAALKRADALLEKADSFELLDKPRFDRIVKSVEDGALVVRGEKQVTEKVEGLGGSFTFCTLGEEMGLDRLLAGGRLPSFEALARYVFHTATGRTLEAVGQASEPAGSRASRSGAGRAPKRKSKTENSRSDDGFIGETELYRVHLWYRPDPNWLRSNEAALSEALVERMRASNPGKKRLLVFAAAKFMSQKELTRLGVEFCQLPYAIHRILGD